MTDEKPQIALIIPIKMKNILDYLVKSKPKEWTAFGKIEPVTDMEGYTAYRLVEIDFPRQTNSGAATDVEPEDFATFAEQLHAKKEPLNQWKLWIHSHNKMGAFWSGTDRSQMESFKSGSFMMSLVVSTTGYKAAFNLFTPLRADFDCEILNEYDATPEEIIKPYADKLASLETVQEFQSFGKQKHLPMHEYDDDYWGAWHMQKDKNEKPEVPEPIQIPEGLSKEDAKDYEDWRRMGYDHEEVMTWLADYPTIPSTKKDKTKK